MGEVSLGAISCGPAHNNDQTHVDQTMPPINKNDTTNKKEVDTTGVDYSKVRK